MVGKLPSHGLARVLSKRGLCSRREASEWISNGRVAVDGKAIRDPEFAIVAGRQKICVDGRPIEEVPRLYLMLNKPRGLLTTTSDERGRDTVFRCLDGAGLPWLAPVGRLDKASEGLLLFCNDSQWAAGITDPQHGLEKTYHVQIDRLPDAQLLDALVAGVQEENGERLRAVSATLLRSGARNAWLEIVLDEGRNRQIRRLLGTFDIGVLRLVRVSIGPLQLGPLAKAAWRNLTPKEVAAFRSLAANP